MRILLTSFTFVFTLVLGAILFAATAIEFPGIMRELIGWAQQLPPYLEQLGLSNTYLVWTDIILSGDKLVLLGYILMTRILIALIATAVGPVFTSGRSRDSAYQQWG